MARAFGSYPKCHRFESSYRYHIQGFAESCEVPAAIAAGVKLRQYSAKPCIIRPDGQAVKTSPFHGGNPGSIPGRVTTQNKSEPFAGWRWVRILCFVRWVYVGAFMTESDGRSANLFSVRGLLPYCHLHFLSWFRAINDRPMRLWWCRIRFPFLVVGEMKHKVGQPLLEGRIILKLLEQFHIIRHNSKDDLL